MNQLTDKELLHYEELLRIDAIEDRKKTLVNIDDSTPKNYAYLYESFTQQRYEDEKLISGKKGVILEGGARSRKTRSAVDFIIHICLHVETNCIINIFRETYNEFKTTLYLDFNVTLPKFGIHNPFENAKEVQSFKIGKNQINFIGADQDKKLHGGESDYIYFNEMLPITHKVYKASTMRCSKFWFGDFNPSVTQHYIFDKVITRSDVGHLRTTFLDNPKCPVGQKTEILSSEPWMPGSYTIENDVIMYQGEPVSDTNQPPPHPTNITEGTADEFYWKVYGLGLRGVMTGVIFQNVNYIDEFPKDLGHIYGNDFGFTADPNAFGKYAETETDIFVEVLCYQCIETPRELSDFYEAIGVEKSSIIVCDSSDKYTGENKGTVEMVSGLRELEWNAIKVSKTKSVMYWLLSMKKKKRINFVKNHLYDKIKAEAENYRFKEISGISINQPIDKFNHIWDFVRYCHMTWNEDFDDETEVE